jgi:hypothetical protein
MQIYLFYQTLTITSLIPRWPEVNKGGFVALVSYGARVRRMA